MNVPDPQAIANAWMSQMSDPAQWQSWFSKVPAADANPLAAIMQDAGATVQPQAMEQLKNQYLEDFGALWQDFWPAKRRRWKTAVSARRPGRAIRCRRLTPHHTCSTPNS